TSPPTHPRRLRWIGSSRRKHSEENGEQDYAGPGNEQHIPGKTRIADLLSLKHDKAITMPKLAANLTMLFNEVDFLDRFEAAAKAGFKEIGRASCRERV